MMNNLKQAMSFYFNTMSTRYLFTPIALDVTDPFSWNSYVK